MRLAFLGSGGEGETDAMGIIGEGTDALLRESNAGSSFSVDVLGSWTLLRLTDDCIELKSSLHSSVRMLLVRTRQDKIKKRGVWLVGWSVMLSH